MSKLWIVHRKASHRQALARIIGLAAEDVVVGAPADDVFKTAALHAAEPAAIVIAFEDDFELELDFLHRYRVLLANTRRRLLVTPEDHGEVKRLANAHDEELIEGPPDARTLRAFTLAAVAHRNAEPLAERLDREHIAQRFSSWFENLEIPGLLRALDPALSALPLLVRGVSGSGRTLVARYAELFRVHGAAGPTLRLDGCELTDTEEIADRIAARTAAGRPPVRTVWVDEVDALPPSQQRALAEWIRLGTAPTTGGIGNATSDALRWITTAGPTGLRDRLDGALESALAPLEVVVPSLADHPETIRSFAEKVLFEWHAQVGGVPRRASDEAVEALLGYAWSGDRGEVEARLRAALTLSSHDEITAADLLASPSDAVSPAASTSDAEPDTPNITGDRLTDPHPFPLDSPAASESFAQDVAEAPIVPPAPQAPPHEPASTRGDVSNDIEPAQFVDEVPETPRFEPSAAPDSPSATSADFERAFLEGLPEAPSGGESTIPGALGDVSTEMASESFRAADPASAPVSGVVAAEEAADQSWRRLARSLSHEIRNPLVSIKTFTELLSENFDDGEFRERFTELVGRDVAHINEVVGRLSTAAAQEKIEAGAVDVSSILERLLDDRREAIGQRRLLVLRELEREAPIAWADAPSLEVALAGLLDRALAALPERGDLFVATRRIDRSSEGEPRLRVLLRHHNPEQSTSVLGLGGSGTSETADVGAAANVLEYVLAETIVQASGGRLTIDTTDAQETLILVDLKTPA